MKHIQLHATRFFILACKGAVGKIIIQVNEPPDTVIRVCGSGAVVKLGHPHRPVDLTKMKNVTCI